MALSIGRWTPGGPQVLSHVRERDAMTRHFAYMFHCTGLSDRTDSPSHGWLSAWAARGWRRSAALPNTRRQSRHFSDEPIKPAVGGRSFMVPRESSHDSAESSHETRESFHETGGSSRDSGGSFDETVQSCRESPPSSHGGASPRHESTPPCREGASSRDEATPSCRDGASSCDESTPSCRDGAASCDESAASRDRSTALRRECLRPSRPPERSPRAAVPNRLIPRPCGTCPGSSVG